MNNALLLIGCIPGTSNKALCTVPVLRRNGSDLSSLDSLGLACLGRTLCPSSAWNRREELLLCPGRTDQPSFWTLSE